MKKHSVPTIEPVTTGGWYERVDGTVGLYSWVDGRLDLLVVVSGWESVAIYKAEARELVI